MRDNDKRRYDIKESNLDFSWQRKAGYNKVSKENSIKLVCPECGHHAFTLCPHSGWFYCWACGIWGQIASPSLPRREDVYNGSKGSKLQSYAPSASGPTPSILEGEPSSSSLDPSPSTLDLHPHKPLPSTLVPRLSSLSLAPSLEDYISLSDDILEGIEDINCTGGVLSGNQDAVHEYLISEKIDPEWAAKMHWGVTGHYIMTKGDKTPKLRPCLVYRNYVDGVCCNAKYRSVFRIIKQRTLHGREITTYNYEKEFGQDSAFTPCAPYNIDSIRNGGGDEPLIITEGEKDCLVLTMMGFCHVISVASGAQTNLEKSFCAFKQWIDQYRTVLIVGDMDVPGRQLTEALTEYFQDRNVRVAHWDQRKYGKDITCVYQKIGLEGARGIVESAMPVERHDIEDYLTEDAIAKTVRYSKGNYDKGYDAGIGPETDKHFRLNSLGGVIIVTGVPGTGKTDFLNYLTMSLIRERRSHVCYCSFETPDKFRHAADLAQIWAGGTDLGMLSDAEVRPFVETVTSHITHIIMRMERPTPEAILMKSENVLLKHPDLEFLVIDPYLYISMPTGKNITETESIKAMLTTVQEWAQAHHIWVFIVAHPRKLQKDDGTKELEEVDMYTIAGSANWANISDFIISLKRIRNKESDYTRLSVLKVRDQKLCTPGDVFYNRQNSGRYDERRNELAAQCNSGTQSLDAWR